LEILEQLAYAVKVRRKFLEEMRNLPWEDIVKNREASFYSMKNIMLHMIDNEDWMVNWVIADKSVEYRRRKWEDYSSFESVEWHLNEVEETAKERLSTLGPNEMNRRVRLVLQNGESFELSVEECLFQALTEQLYHMGELIALFWQQNIEPPKMQWFYNKNGLV
jgi:uncharacterized damage-inducible protein DinB